jgi:hypothetical protein
LHQLTSKAKAFHWTEACDNAFKCLKKELASTSVVRHPDFERDFILCTDASSEGMGAVLSQKDDSGVERPVAFASKSLNPAQKDYSVTKKECLALVDGVKKFRHTRV